MDATNNEPKPQDRLPLDGQCSSSTNSGAQDDRPIVDYATPNHAKKQKAAGGELIAGLAFFGGVGWGIFSAGLGYEKLHGHRVDEESFKRCLVGYAVIVILLLVVPKLARTLTFKALIIGVLLGCGVGMLLAGVCG